MKRLSEDLQNPDGLRDDLQRSRAAGYSYDTEHKLAQLRAAIADPARDPLAERSPRQLSWSALHPGWKLAALLVLGGAAAVVLRAAAKQEPTAAAVVSVPVPPPVADEVTPPTAAEAEPVLQPSLPEPKVQAAPEANSSRREIAQLVQIRALLQRDPLGAYRLAQRSEREFPRGVLSEERQALSIIALHKGGKVAPATSKARVFFARFPHSPMREMIEAELTRGRK